MSSRRQIREAVVQYLYAADPSEPLLPAPLESPALELLLEPLRHRLTTARAKAVVHLQQGRGQSREPYTKVVRRLARLELAEEGDSSLRAVHELDQAEASFQTDLDLLQRELHGNKDAARLAALLEQLRLANQQSRAAAARLSSATPDLPALASIREDALALTTALPRYAERLEDALAPQTPERSELRAVRRALTTVTEMQDNLTDILEGLAKHLHTLDEHIHASLENYRPERIDRVDRAILRLGTYELLHGPELPPAVAINEAIELARAFGTTDSPRFVNGILDHIHRQHNKSQEDQKL